MKKYKDQFVTPFKTITYYNLAVKSTYSANQGFQKFASMGKVLSQINDATKNKLKEEAAKIKEER